MRIFDRTILALPFFDETHRRLAEEIETWIAAQAESSVFAGTNDVKEQVRRISRILGEAGWFNSIVGMPSDTNDGARPDFRTICLIREGLSFFDDLYDFSFSIQGLASAPIVYYGNQEQRLRFLPDLRCGRQIGSFAITEPEVGSNLAAIQLSAVRKDDHYVLNGEKTWISNGNIADYHCVFARTGEGPGPLGLSCFVVAGGAPGVSIKEDIALMASRPIACLQFSNCVVPNENLIGKAGYGFQYAMQILDRYRTTVGSVAIGFGRRALQAALERSKSRRVLDGHLFDLQMTKEKFAEMAVFLDAAALLVARTAWEIDVGVRNFSKHSSIAKLYATEGAQKVVDDALQLFGAAGTVAGSVPERLFRQTRLLRIYEGTSEIQKLIIAGCLDAG